MTDLRLVVLEAVGFVDDEHSPVDTVQDRLVDADQFVRGEQYVELDPLVRPHPRRLRTAAHRSFDERKLVLSEDEWTHRSEIQLATLLDRSFLAY